MHILALDRDLPDSTICKLLSTPVSLQLYTSPDVQGGQHGNIGCRLNVIPV